MPRLLLILLSLLAPVSARAGEVERLYVIDCGYAHAEDQSLWSPGIGVGIPIDFSNSCYLIHHSSEGYLLWDTGITDRLAALPQGQAVPPLRQTWYRNKLLVATLAAIDLKPADVRHIAISHIHPDHIGNIDAFSSAAVRDDPERASPSLAQSTGCLRSSGRNCVSMMRLASPGGSMAPSCTCSSNMRFMPAGWNAPSPK
jgi:Metallo-beta-lactamase superfamily